MKRIINYIKQWMALLKWRISLNMVEVNETMALKEVSETYAKYVCKMYGWETRWLSDYTAHFCAISFALMDGYIKAMHDNGYEFQNGLVKKRDIMNEMPCGALDYYRKDAVRDTKRECIAALEKVMAQYETSKANINTIVSAFRKEIKED